MKKLLALILAALMLFSITACNTTQNNLDGKGDDTQNTVNNNEGGDSNNPSDNNSSDNNPSDNNPSNSDDFVKIGKIVDGYHEGLMFIENYANMEMHTISCIDKTGKTVFSIEASYIISGFHNGLALVMQEKAVLCDKTGKIITAQELGASSFVIVNSEIFNDGFILVSKTTTSYQGSVDEMAVFNSKLEKIVDFSKELYDYCENEFSYSNYYNGYLIEYDNYGNGCILDLRTGMVSDDLARWCENMELKNETDLWAVGEDGGVHFFSTPGDESYFIYDSRDLYSAQESWPVITPVIDLSETGGRIRSKDQMGNTGFVDGYAALVFEVEDSEVGERHYFTILGKDGNYCFEPVEIAGLIDEIKTENGIFVLSIVPRNRNETTYYIEVYDISGRIGVKEYQKSATSFWSFDFDISDGVIFIQCDDYTTSGKEWIGIYKTDMKPLFDVEIVTDSQ